MGIARSGTQADVGPRQGDLFAQGQPVVNGSAAMERLELDGRSWIDLATRWLLGGDELFEQLAGGLALDPGRAPDVRADGGGAPPGSPPQDPVGGARRR